MPYLTPQTTPATFICRRLRIPNDIGYLMAVNGALAELALARNWEQFGDVTPEEARAAMLNMLLDTLDSVCDEGTPEPGEMLIFTPDASLITYAPQDPFAAGDVTPPGYVLPPFYHITGSQLPFPGVQVGDVLTDLSKLPTAWPPLLPPDGYPRFRVNFHVTGPGPGQVELHLVKLPLAGLALVTVDDDPAKTDFIDLATVDALDLGALNQLLGTVLDGDLVRTHIQEIWISEVGNHHIDVTFLPKIGGSSLIGFGGGLRQVVLGGTAGAGEMPAPQFRLTDGVLEWRPHDSHVWMELGDLTGPAGPVGTPITDVQVTTLAPGSAATGQLVNGVLTLGIPEGEKGDPGSAAGIAATEVIEVSYDAPGTLQWNPVAGKLTLELPTGHPPETPGIQATELIPLGYNDPPSLVFNPATKKLTLELPTGHPPQTPGILATEVIPLSCDDPASLTFNPSTKKLTLSLPTPLCASGDTLYAEPPAPKPRPEPAPDKRCAAAANAASVYYDLAHEMSRQADAYPNGFFFIAAQFARYAAPLLNFAIGAAWFEYLSSNAAFQSNVISTLGAIQAEALLSPQGDLGPYLYEQFNSTTLAQMKCAFYCAANSEGVIDYTTALAEMADDDRYPALLAVHSSIVSMMGPGGMAAAGSAQITSVYDCSACECVEACQEFDFTTGEHGFSIAPPSGNHRGGIYVLGEGFQSTATSTAPQFSNVEISRDFGGVTATKVEVDFYRNIQRSGAADRLVLNGSWVAIDQSSPAGLITLRQEGNLVINRLGGYLDLSTNTGATGFIRAVRIYGAPISLSGSERC